MEGRAAREPRRDGWAECGGESHPGRSFLSGEKTFSGRPESFSCARGVWGGGELRVCTTRGDSLSGPQGGEWGSPREGLKLSAQQWYRIENKIARQVGDNPVGHGKGWGVGLDESVTSWGNRLGTPAKLKILGSDAAGRSRGPDLRPPHTHPGGEGCSRAPRPRLRVGEAPLQGGMWDADDGGTQAEPRDRKRKFACLSCSPST